MSDQPTTIVNNKHMDDRVGEESLAAMTCSHFVIVMHVLSHCNTERKQTNTDKSQ